MPLRRKPQPSKGRQMLMMLAAAKARPRGKKGVAVLAAGGLAAFLKKRRDSRDAGPPPAPAV